MGHVTSICSPVQRNVIQVQSAGESTEVVPQNPASKSEFGEKWVSSINLAGPVDKSQFVMPISEREVYVLMRSWRGIKDRMTDIGTATFLRYLSQVNSIV